MKVRNPAAFAIALPPLPPLTRWDARGVRKFKTPGYPAFLLESGDNEVSEDYAARLMKSALCETLGLVFGESAPEEDESKPL